jgi:hypothetical protein
MKIEINPDLLHRLMDFYKAYIGRFPESDSEIMYAVYMLFEYYDGERTKKDLAKK